MSLYYDRDGIQIWHGDCREILPGLEFDVIVTDPPYGISHRRGTAGDRGKGRTLGASEIVGDAVPFDPSHLIVRECILWGANYYADKLPPGLGRWLVWDKQEHGGSGDFSEGEVAWHSRGRALKFFRHMWLGVQRASETGGARLHPTQKPVALMRWCLGLVSLGVVCDPYMGSGPTLRAAKDEGRRAIGIEIEEKYCEVAARRLDQGVLDFGE